MRRTQSYYVHILTNCYERKQRSIPGFASKYNTTRLLHYEETDDVWTAIEREKQIEG